MKKIALIAALLLSTSALAQQSKTMKAPSGSLTLATGGTSQMLFQTAEVFSGCTITNPATAIEPIWVNFFTTAQGLEGTTSIPVPVGSSIPCGDRITGPISWIAATTGHKINAIGF